MIAVLESCSYESKGLYFLTELDQKFLFPLYIDLLLARGSIHGHEEEKP